MDLLNLESIFKTQIEVRVKNLLDGAYPDIMFTTEYKDNPPSFPSVYIHELEPTERGNDLANDKIHAIKHNVQIEVTTNTTKGDSRRVINACVDACKMLRYTTTFPVHQQVNNMHRHIIRVHRIVGSGDKF